MGERKYFVLSLKHLYPWKFGETLCLWGNKRTKDNEYRCYGGYSGDIQRAELYSSEEFLKEYGRCTKKDPLTALIPSELRALKKVFDCVLVPKDVVERYYKDCGLIKENVCNKSEDEIKALEAEADKVIADLEESHKKEVEQLLMEIAKLKEERRWRKFSEEKPKEKQWILVFVENPSKYGTYIELRRWDAVCKFDVEDQELYTEWMPMPKAPEVK